MQNYNSFETRKRSDMLNLRRQKLKDLLSDEGEELKYEAFNKQEIFLIII